jgi:hypothetical protein
MGVLGIKNEFTFEDFCTWAERNQTDFGLDANKFDIFSYMNNQPEINTHSYAELVDNSVSYQPLEQSYTQVVSRGEVTSITLSAFRS